MQDEIMEMQKKAVQVQIDHIKFQYAGRGSGVAEKAVPE